MERILDAADFEIDGWLRHYIWTTVGFAAWHHGFPVSRVRVELARETDERDRPYVRCTLHAQHRDGDEIASGTTGADVFEAVGEAADLLEAALYRPAPMAPVPAHSVRRAA